MNRGKQFLNIFGSFLSLSFFFGWGGGSKADELHASLYLVLSKYVDLYLFWLNVIFFLKLV